MIDAMMNQDPGRASRAGSLPLVGGSLALDFCNTASGRDTEGHIEHFGAVDHVLVWARHANILDEDRLERLRSLCAADPALSDRLFCRALAFRDAVYRLNRALATGRAVDQADLDSLADIHSACLSKGHLLHKDGAFGWTWTIDDAPEEAILGPIAASAMMVLTAADRARLKRCDGHHCGWLFLDTTKSNNRRWCEMDPCGNRAKQRRWRSRRRQDDERP